MNELRLDGSEVEAISSMLESARPLYAACDDETFIDEATHLAHGLPTRLRTFVNDFRLSEPFPGVCLISGLHVDDAAIGDTPHHWRCGTGPAVAPYAAYLLLIGSLLGEPFAWATQQDGRFVHEVLPIREHEFEQLGSGSREQLWWHTEDAFHDCRGDYLCLLCLRNPYSVATTYACVDQVAIGEAARSILFEPRFQIRPDLSHLAANNGAESPGSDLFSRIDRMRERPKKVPVLFGDYQSPYWRLDPYFMKDQEDQEAQEALDLLSRSVDALLCEIVLRPGDCLIIDNYRAVHGRRPFVARFDGTDRWLKRINVTRDLRRSRRYRRSVASRILC